MDLKLMGNTNTACSPKYQSHDALTSVLYKSINFQKYDLVVEKTTGQDGVLDVYIHLHEKLPRNEELGESIVWWLRYQMAENGRIFRGMENFVSFQIPLHLLTDKVAQKILLEG